MTDPYAAWLDEALGGMIRHHIQLAPTVAAGYARAFQGAPVGQDWLIATGSSGPAPVAATEPSADAGSASDVDPAVDQLNPDLDPALRATVDDLLPYLSAEDTAIVAGMTAPELAAAVEEARSETLAGLVDPLPEVTTDEVLEDDEELDGAREELADDAAGLDPSTGSDVDPDLAELPFAGVSDEELAEAVAGIVPDDAPAALKAEIGALLPHLDDTDKELLRGLTIEEIQTELGVAERALTEEFAELDRALGGVGS